MCCLRCCKVRLHWSAWFGLLADRSTEACPGPRRVSAWAVTLPDQRPAAIIRSLLSTATSILDDVGSARLLLIANAVSQLATSDKSFQQPFLVLMKQHPPWLGRGISVGTSLGKQG